GGERLKAPGREQVAVREVEWWQKLGLVNPRALDDQVEAIGLVARELGPGVPVIQTVFSPLTVAGYLVGRSKSRVMRDLRKHAEVVEPALQRIADVLVDFSERSVDAGAAGIFYAISGYGSRDTMPEQVYRDLVLPLELSVLAIMLIGACVQVWNLSGTNLHL